MRNSIHILLEEFKGIAPSICTIRKDSSFSQSEEYKLLELRDFIANYAKSVCRKHIEKIGKKRIVIIIAEDNEKRCSRDNDAKNHGYGWDIKRALYHGFNLHTLFLA